MASAMRSLTRTVPGGAPPFATSASVTVFSANSRAATS